MGNYAELKKIFDAKGVVILDGAIGTQLQEMGVPMDNTSWAASGLRDYPATIQFMHEAYVKAGAQVITTNTYSSARHNLEPLGLGDFTREFNLRAVLAARNARDHAGQGRKVWIAGAISSFGITTEGEGVRALHRFSRPRSHITAETAQANLIEQAQILADGGVDFLIVEGTGENTHRKWMIEACRRTGLPFWLGFRVRLDVKKQVKIGYSSTKGFDQALDETLSPDLAGVAIFHSPIDAVDPAMAILKGKWKGLIAVYPEAGRHDYTTTWHDHSEENAVKPDEYAEMAKRWVAGGAQMIGGCCGIGIPYIEKLAATLPKQAA